MDLCVAFIDLWVLRGNSLFLHHQYQQHLASILINPLFRAHLKTVLWYRSVNA